MFSVFCFLIFNFYIKRFFSDNNTIYIEIIFFFFLTANIHRPRRQLGIHVYNERRLVPSTACQAIRLYVFRLWYMNDIWVGEASSQKHNVFQVAFKCWSFLWFQNHLHQLRTIRCKRHPKLS